MTDDPRETAHYQAGDWHFLKSLCGFIVEGPRSILSPVDPTGGSYWLECDLALVRFSYTPAQLEARQIYLPPNVIKHRRPHELLVRIASWDQSRDRLVAKAGALPKLSLSVLHHILTEALIDQLNERVLAFDAQLIHFSFDLNGLDLEPITYSPTARVTTQGRTLSVIRRGHDRSARLSWSYPGQLDELYAAWMVLWDGLAGATEDCAPAIGYIERFALEPGAYIDWHSTDDPQFQSELREFVRTA
jgi:hypothetical protein